MKAGEAAGFEVTVWDEKAIKAERLGGLLGVNRGSDAAPAVPAAQLRARQAARARVALVGKGITFDSGGLSIKTADGMIGMKGDMGGGAAVLGAFRAIAALGAKVRVLGFVPLTDNMTGGDATRVGDVLTIRNGTTVEVLNTDAEGRLDPRRRPQPRHRGRARRHRRPRHPHRRVHGGPRGAHRRADGQPPGLDRPGARARPTRPGSRCGRCRCPRYLRGKLDSDVADLKNVTSTR